MSRPAAGRSTRGTPARLGAVLLSAASLLAVSACRETSICAAYALGGSVTVRLPVAVVTGQPDGAQICLGSNCAVASLLSANGTWQVETRPYGYGGETTLVDVRLLGSGRSAFHAQGRVPVGLITSGEGVCQQRAMRVRAHYDESVRTLVAD